MPISALYEHYKRVFQQRLSSVDALPQLAILGLISGSVTALVIILFRFCIEWPLGWLLPNGDPENFEGLSQLMRVSLPLTGAVLIGIIWYRLQISQRKVGVAFVMERLNYHQGYISFRSLVTQFVGGVLTLTSGQSAGREGPAVHLGAACSSLMGQKLKLPNNSIRVLISCGTAAAISASFNTPIAGVIFAMEVVMMEYTITGFTPVILASVAAAIITQAVYGNEPAFLVPQLFMNSLWEVPFVVLCGVLIGLASAGFVGLLRHSMHYTHYSIFYRIMAAGTITAAGALLFPEIMGIGYDTVNAALLGQMGVYTLLGIAAFKIVITATSVGLGMPNGLVGPTLFIGATLGGAMGLISNWLMPELSSSTGFYAMLGMGAMMGSVLQAPLAALMALLELTHNPNIILPGMLIIVVSSMVASEGFKQRSVFLTILQEQGLDYQNSPVTQALQRVGVAAIMEREFVQSDKTIDLATAKALLRKQPKWILINNSSGKAISLLPTADLARFLEENEAAFIAAEEDPMQERMLINLLEIPAQRKDVAPVYFQATLQEALDRFNESGTEALFVERTSAPMIKRVVGIVTRTDIENYYQYKGQA
ncbi:MAG: chloride channel protein [Oleiphilaceae bacterium]|nr:chloride channel protein [Oleiphilaceae bacterium]